ncbi:MAG: hypothetical protein ABIR47_11980 [Candidatus Kapaibacterium sp.]
MTRFHARRAAFCIGLALVSGGAAAWAQVELLPVDHPATAALVRLYEFGLIPGFPREHLPITRGAALRFLDEALADRRITGSLKSQAEYYRVELAVDRGEGPVGVIFPTGDSTRSILDDPFAGHPFAIADYHDPAAGLHVALLPVLDGELRVDPKESRKAMVAQGGLELRGTALNHIGFAARITNGSIAGDSVLAARDPRIRRNGSFSVTAFGRDVGFGSGHIRAEVSDIAVEVGKERIQLGGGLDQSLLLGAPLPSEFDYLRLTARIGRFSFSHIHGSLLSEPVTALQSGPFSDIPDKYIAAHLLSFGPFAGLRASIGESVIYHGRGIQIGYLNPFIFMKAEEQYLRDRDNANMYLALSFAPADRLFLEGELMIDDLKFSKIGDGFIGNKVGWRLAAKGTGLPADPVDLSVAVTHLEPFIFTHFNQLNSYTHDSAPLAAGGQQPNSYLIEPRVAVQILPNFHVGITLGLGLHGANVTDSLGGMVRNVGGDINRTADTTVTTGPIRFLDGTEERLLDMKLEAEYEPIRNIYLRLLAQRNQTKSDRETFVDTQIWFGLRIGAF